MAPPLANLSRSVLARVRQRGRHVHYPDPSKGFGNLLYHYLHAHTAQREGRDEWVLERPKIQPWLTVFPRLAQRNLSPKNFRFTDQRDLEDYQGFGTSFTREDLDLFIQEVLNGGYVDDQPSHDPSTVVINIRRGDYYSTQWKPYYGFDIPHYLQVAITHSDLRAPISHIYVVSDDREWSLREVSRLVPPGIDITHSPKLSSPVLDFADLARASRLIITNSTFSYWGAFLSGVRHSGNQADIVAPHFHRRDINGGLAWHLDPRWTIIDDPNGWPQPAGRRPRQGDETMRL